MKNENRRSFLSRGAAGIALLGFLGNAMREAEAQLVWRRSEWNLLEFQNLIRDPAKIKQVYDVSAISNEAFLNSMKNSLNALQVGFGIPKEQIKVVGALHGPANMLNYDDFVLRQSRP